MVTKIIAFIIKKFLIGLVSLFVINMIGQFFNFNIPINYFTIFLVGIFKLPGIIFIIAIMLI